VARAIAVGPLAVRRIAVSAIALRLPLEGLVRLPVGARAPLLETVASVGLTVLALAVTPVVVGPVALATADCLVAVSSLAAVSALVAVSSLAAIS